MVLLEGSNFDRMFVLKELVERRSVVKKTIEGYICRIARIWVIECYISKSLFCISLVSIEKHCCDKRR